MIAFSRFLAWLAVPVIAFCSFNVLAETAEGAPKALHLLDYIGADYPATVEAGKITTSDGYRLAKLEPAEAKEKVAELIEHAPRTPGKKRSKKTAASRRT